MTDKAPCGLERFIRTAYISCLILSALNQVESLSNMLCTYYTQFSLTSIGSITQSPEMFQNPVVTDYSFLKESHKTAISSGNMGIGQFYRKGFWGLYTNFLLYKLLWAQIASDKPKIAMLRFLLHQLDKNMPSTISDSSHIALLAEEEELFFSNNT